MKKLAIASLEIEKSDMSFTYQKREIEKSYMKSILLSHHVRKLAIASLKIEK